MFWQSNLGDPLDSIATAYPRAANPANIEEESWYGRAEKSAAKELVIIAVIDAKAPEVA